MFEAHCLNNIIFECHIHHMAKRDSKSLHLCLKAFQEEQKLLQQYRVDNLPINAKGFQIKCSSITCGVKVFRHNVVYITVLFVIRCNKA